MDLFACSRLLTAQNLGAKMLCHRLVHWDDCGVVWILHTTWCIQRTVRRKEEYREFASINHRQSNNLGFQTLSAEN